MGLFKRAHVNGMVVGLARAGLIQFPNDKIAEEVADAVADNIPDEMVPEVSGEEGLTAEEAAEVIDQIVGVAEQIAEKTGSANDDFNKIASAVDIEMAAGYHAQRLMQKAAAEYGQGGTDVTGDGQHQQALMEGGMGDIDAVKNPSSEVVGPQGSSKMDTSAGAVGAEVSQEEPGAPPIDQEVAKLSSILEDLIKGASTSPGSEPGTPAKVEPSDNQVIPGATVPQGKTNFDSGDVIGDEKKHPEASGKVDTKGDMALPSKEAADKLAQMLVSNPELRKAVADKLAEESCDSKKEEKKEEKKEMPEEMKEEKKEASAVNALLAAVKSISAQS